MKRTAMNLMMTLVCAAVLATVAAAAFTTALMTAKIPFDFNVGNQTLPAGTYTVSRSDTNSVVILRNEKSAKSMLLVTNASQGGVTNEKAQLDFRRYGDQYFLGAIKPAGTNNNFVAPTSRRERAVAEEAKNLARRQTSPEIVTITSK